MPQFIQKKFPLLQSMNRVLDKKLGDDKFLFSHEDFLMYNTVRPGARRVYFSKHRQKFDHTKICTLTGTFKIFIAAGVDPHCVPK